MSAAIHTLADLLGKAAHLTPNEVVAVVSWDASGGTLGPMPSTYRVADLLMGLIGIDLKSRGEVAGH